MNPIGKSKITKHQPKKDIKYLMVRLLQSHAHLIGETAHIFEIDNNGSPFFLILLGKNFDGNIKIVQSSVPDLETRVESLEKHMKSLEKSLQTTGSSLRKSEEQPDHASGARNEVMSSAQHLTDSRTEPSIVESKHQNQGSSSRKPKE